jgi:hypothetical protein
VTRRRDTIVDESLPPLERLIKAIQGYGTEAERLDARRRHDAAVRQRQARVMVAFESRIRERWAARWEEDWRAWSHRDPTREDRAGRFWLLVEMRGRTWTQRHLDAVPSGSDPLVALELAHDKTRPIEYRDIEKLRGL